MLVQIALIFDNHTEYHDSYNHSLIIILTIGNVELERSKYHASYLPRIPATM